MKKLSLQMAAMTFVIACLSLTSGCAYYGERLTLGWAPQEYEYGEGRYWNYYSGPPEEMVWGNQGWYYPNYSAVFWGGAWCWGYDPGHHRGGQVYFPNRFGNPYPSGHNFGHGGGNNNSHGGGGWTGGGHSGQGGNHNGGQSSGRGGSGGNQGGSNHGGGNTGHSGGSRGGNRGGH